jgi:UDP-hydrolysing UDP-N-acetyl-D-glucosamine 2-epimerase
VTVSIAAVTTGRADYGLLHPLLALLVEDNRFDLHLIVTGSHLREDQGMTVGEIESDGLPVFRRASLPSEGDDALSVARAMGAGVSLLAEAIEASGADILVVLGDRYEAFAAASAAVVLGVPVAHIHGGELTLGSIDDAFRHAITKLSALHFASTEEHRRRIVQMGEPGFAVFNVGALAVDNVRCADLLSEEAFEQAYGFGCGPDTLLVTFHPVTRGGDSLGELRELLDALESIPELRVLFTAPNVDAGGGALRDALEAWVQSHPARARLVTALGWRGYLSAARNCAAVAGNSSSGLIEVPALGVPSVDVGTRQAGRSRPQSVVHAAADAKSIEAAIRQALLPSHGQQAAVASNPYGDGRSAERIAEALADRQLLHRARLARFVDLDFKE